MSDLYSISRLSKLFRQDRRDVSSALSNVAPAGMERGHPVWNLEDAAPALARPVSRSRRNDAAEAPGLVPPGFEFLTAIGDPQEAAAAYALVALAYRVPAVAAMLVVSAGGDCKVAYAVGKAMKHAACELVGMIGREMDCAPWSYNADPQIWRADMFHEPIWPRLAEEAGEKVAKGAWERHARKAFAPPSKTNGAAP